MTRRWVRKTREAIQKEISSLKDEVDRISKGYREYNTKTLLDGSLDTRVYTKHASRIQVTDQVSPGNYEIKVKTAATQAEVTSGADFNSTAAIGVSGTMSVNGSTVEIAATDTYQEVYEKLRTAGEIGETQIERSKADGSPTFTTDAYGSDATLKLSFSNQALANQFALSDASGNNGLVQDPATKQWIYGSQQTDASGKTTTKCSGTDRDMELDDVANWKGFTSSATAKCDGNRVTITDLGGFSLSFLVEAGYEDGATKTDSAGNVLETYDGSLKFEVTDMGTMTLHIGANMDQNMNIRIPEISCESLYIDDLDVTTVNGADRALDRLDDAIARVSEARSNLGSL